MPEDRRPDVELRLEIDQAVHGRLEAIAEERGVTLEAVARDALVAYVAQHVRPDVTPEG